MSRKRVIVAMSGGVDSSVAALLLKEAGYEVSGVYLSLWDTPHSEYQQGYAGQVCRVLDIPLDIVDLRQEFARYVVDYFCREYQQGRTPNPCVACNRHIKLGSLLGKALASGADYLATGHYAGIERSEDDYHLLKASDRSKDQGYFLYTLTQEKLQHLLFPLGKYTKAEVKKIAREGGLPASDKPSRDLCFISDKNYRDFLSRHFPASPGEMVDSRGKIVGHHRGIALYTIGQRHGLGAVSGKPLYVIRMESGDNRVVLGDEEELYCQEAAAGEASWTAGTPPAELDGITAKIRYRSTEVPVTLSLKGESIAAWFPQPQRAVTPGQAIVFYRGDEVLGGGIVESFSPLSPDKARANTVPALRS